MARVRPAGPGVRLVRPLLDVSAAEVEAYVAARGFEPVRDPTNASRAYRRSRLRHEVLPLLRRERPDLDRAIARTCEHLRADADALDAEAARALAALTDEEAALDVRGLLDLPDAIAARVVAFASGIALEAVHIEAVQKLCASTHGTRSIDLPGGVAAERRYDRLRFGLRKRDPGDVEVVITAPGRYRLLEREVEIAPELLDALGTPLTLRNLRPGDRQGGARLKTRLIDQKVPRPERRWLPLLAKGNEVIWHPGLLLRGLQCHNVADSPEAGRGSGHQTK
jgi:hypothetical protein